MPVYKNFIPAREKPQGADLGFRIPLLTALDNRRVTRYLLVGPSWKGSWTTWSVAAHPTLHECALLRHLALGGAHR